MVVAGLTSPVFLGRAMDAVIAFLKSARTDIEAARALLQEGLFAPSIFHSQQAAEKLAKAFLDRRGVYPGHTHDVADLLRQVQDDHGPSELRQVVDELEKLQRHVLNTRYPSRDHHGRIIPPEQAYSEQDARSALRRAERVYNMLSEGLQ